MLDYVVVKTDKIYIVVTQQQQQQRYKQIKLIKLGVFVLLVSCNNNVNFNFF
jgi:hypothetical protein